MGSNDEGSSSKFNAGIALTERIDSLQRAINAAKFNPFARNPETGTFNYENLIAAFDNLVAEGWDKFSSDEKKICLRVLKILRKLNEELPPISMTRDGDYKVNMDNYKRFRDFFGYAERKIKDFYGKHNLNSPSMDEDDDYDY